MKFKKINKKIIVTVILIILILTIFIFYNQLNKKIPKELNIINFENYIDPNLIKQFEDNNNIKINIHQLPRSTDIYNEIKQNSVNYDLAIIGSQYMDELIKENLIQTINKFNIPNYKYTHKACEQKQDSDKIYSVPYNWGTIGILYNSKKITKKIDSWGIFWDYNYSQKMVLDSDNINVIGMASKYTGNPLVPQTIIQFLEVEKFLLELKPIILGFEQYTNIKDKLISEEILIAQTFDGEARRLKEEYSHFKYVIPIEGTSKWITNFVILKESKNKYASELFINFIQEANNSAQNANFLKYTSCNYKAMELSDKNIFEDNLKGINIEFLETFNQKEPAEITELREKLWIELNK